MSGRSSCPECGTILRIRDRTFVGRRVHCPECKTTLRIESEDDQGQFVARRLSAADLSAVAQSHRKSVGSTKSGNPDKILLPTSPSRLSFRRVIESPLTVAWLLGIAITSLIAVLALAPKTRFASARPVPVGKLEEANDPAQFVSPPQPDSSREIAVEPVIPFPEINTDVDDQSVSAIEPTNVEGPLVDSPGPNVEDVAGVRTDLPPPVPVKIDVEAKMSQKLVSYKQTKPVSRRDLIEALQEHLGARLLYDADELGAATLDAKVTFELENTTVGGVIKSVADTAGWEIQVEDQGLRLTRKKSLSGG